MISDPHHPYYLKQFWKDNPTILRITSLVLLIVLPVFGLASLSKPKDILDVGQMLLRNIFHSKREVSVPPGWIAFEEEVYGGETDERVPRPDQAGY